MSILNVIGGNLEEAVFKAKEFAEAHLGYMDEEEREAIINTEKHRYQSFSPVRQDIEVKWYIDGKDYFWAVSEAIESAKHHIYIEDWWLSPELVSWCLESCREKARKRIYLMLITTKHFLPNRLLIPSVPPPSPFKVPRVSSWYSPQTQSRRRRQDLYRRIWRGARGYGPE